MIAGNVILEVTWVQSVELSHCWKYIVIQNSAVGIGIELSIKQDQGSQTKPGKISPDHNFFSAEINCGHNTFWMLAFTRQTPNPEPKIQMVEIGTLIHLSRKKNSTTVWSTVQVLCIILTEQGG